MTKFVKKNKHFALYDIFLLLQIKTIDGRKNMANKKISGDVCVWCVLEGAGWQIRVV